MNVRSRFRLDGRAALPLAVATLVLVGAGPSSARTSRAALASTPIASPAQGSSHEPNLSALPDGRVAMSWLESRGTSRLALRCAIFDGTRWSVPTTIAQGDSFFANWADFPSIRALGGNRLAAHWLWKSGAGTYAYDVRVSHSQDGGQTWSAPMTPHRDGTATEHGFVSLVPSEQGVMAIWLDGRNSAGHTDGHGSTTPDMTLRAAVLTRDGGIEQEALLDGRTCDCCQTAAVRTARGVVVAYRDRSADEVRDVYVTRLEDGRWSTPARLHPDDWHIAGCPVNGPALDASGSKVVVAWYSGADSAGAVRVAFSTDGGATFAAPVRVDGGNPLGRVHVVLQADGRALVTWLETQGKSTLIRGRQVSSSGSAGDPVTLAQTSSARASGFPRLARSSRMTLLAWTEAGSPSRIRVARLGIR